MYKERVGGSSSSLITGFLHHRYGSISFASSDEEEQAEDEDGAVAKGTKEEGRMGARRESEAALPTETDTES